MERIEILRPVLNCPHPMQALADPYFAGLSQPGREPSAQPVSKVAFDFERRKLSSNDVSLYGPNGPYYAMFTPEGG